MADLDDFFAKKDRKKSKNVKKITTADGAGKTDDVRRYDKLGDRSCHDGDDPKSDKHDEDEWKEFEEEKKDYTGLKIVNLNINSDSGGPDGCDDDGASDSGSTGDQSQSDNPRQKDAWKRVEQPAAPAAPAQQEKPSSVDSKGLYVPVHLRGNRQPVSNQGPSKLRSKAAPDINNEKFFPTLSGGKPAENTGVWGKKTRKEGAFEEVRHSKGSLSRSSIDQRQNQGSEASQGPKLSLGNRYNSLSTNES